MNVALLLLLYTNFIINFYQILPCVNCLCTMARSPFVLKHITSSSSVVVVVVIVVVVVVVVDISQETGVNVDDVISTLQFYSMLKYWKGKHIVLKNKVSVK